jgi:glycosyltransferase involved in cell wall biosynthesis
MVSVALIHYRLVARGGLESRLQNYIQAFLSLNCKVELIAAWMHPDFYIPEQVKVTLIKPGIYPKWYLQASFGNKVKSYLKSGGFDLSFAMFRIPGVDILVVPGTHLGYRKALGKQFFTFSDLAQIALDRKCFQSSGLLLAASRKMKEELIKLHDVPENKITVAFPPVNQKLYTAVDTSQKQALRLKHEIPIHHNVFLFVSSGHAQKGRKRVIAAWKKASPTDATLLLIGKKKSDSKAAGIIDLGFRTEVNEFYQLADALVHPAQYEAYGQVIAESLACECPVLISSGCGALELLEPGWGEVFEWDNESAWVNAFHSFKPENYSVDRDKVLQKIPTALQVIQDILLPTINKKAQR